MKEEIPDDEILKIDIKQTNLVGGRKGAFIIVERPNNLSKENKERKKELTEKTFEAINNMIFECKGDLTVGWIASIIKEKKEEGKDILDLTNFGMIVLTDFRFIFHLSVDNSKKENFKEDFFEIPYLLIKEIKKEKISKGTSLIISLIDGTEWKFLLSNENENNEDLFKRLKNKAINNRKELLKFPKTFNNYLKIFEKEFNGWEIYNFRKEFERQGLELDDKDFPLRISNKNENFGFIASYPKYLIEPKKIDDKILENALNFRSEKRVPTLTYYYKNDLNKGTKKLISGIWRSSQVASGLLGSKDVGDIKLLNEISELGDKLYIFDARPKEDAFMQKVGGYGSENVQNYDPNPEYIYCEIRGIRFSKTAFNKIKKLCNDKEIMENNNFLSKLEDSGWINFIIKVLKTSTKISELVMEGNNVLVHCSEGWDRTPQLVSISQILLDPYFRTFEGFAILFEKDFVSFGHKFAIRSGITEKEFEKKTNQVILQYLDCVYQLLMQFPSEFEFTSEFLLFIAKYYDTNLFGTFLFDNEKEREEKHAKTETASIWTYLLGEHFENKEKYLNRLYDKEKVTKILTPHYAYYDYVLWTDYFLRNNIYAEK
jgi:hypothetical protein